MGNSKIVYYGETLIDLTGDTVTKEKLLKGITAHDKKGEKVTGTLADVTQATPAITVDAAGKITASATQAAGVVAAGTKSATKQLTVQAEKTVTPSASAQTAVAKGVFTTGIVTVAAVYAVIGVTYPAGSTVTCTNGSTTLRAKDTTGKALFVIPSAGTWTVKAVKGSQSKSAAVKITTKGQVETVTLVYQLYIITDGKYNRSIGFNTQIRSSASMSMTENNGTLELSLAASQYSAGRATDVKIDINSYSNLKCDYTMITYKEGKNWFGLCNIVGVSSEAALISAFVCEKQFAKDNNRHTDSLDISALTGSFYIGAKMIENSADIGIHNLWLE